MKYLYLGEAFAQFKVFNLAYFYPLKQSVHRNTPSFLFTTSLSPHKPASVLSAQFLMLVIVCQYLPLVLLF